MLLQSVQERIQYVESAFERAHKLPDDPEIQADWARYLCVLASGNIEVCFVEIFSAFSRFNSATAVHQYVMSQLSWFQNPKPKKIIDLHRQFSEPWGNEISGFLAGQKGDAIQSIVSNRNSIAHGETCVVTISRIHDWFEQSKEVIAFSHDLVLSDLDKTKA